MPFRLIVSGSLVIGFVTGLWAYNVAGMKGVWLEAVELSGEQYF